VAAQRRCGDGRGAMMGLVEIIVYLAAA
jgi:hypothetical protein